MVEVETHQRAGVGLTLVTGPTRSGKSRWAESLLSDQTPVIYMATGPCRPGDAAWQDRLQMHRQRRPLNWSTVECGGDLNAAMASISLTADVLVDSLGGVVASHLECTCQQWQVLQESLIDRLKLHQGTVVIVIEETGWGVVPSTAIGGLFRERLGSFAQTLEQFAVQSWLVIQGRALNLTQIGQPVR